MRTLILLYINIRCWFRTAAALAKQQSLIRPSDGMRGQKMTAELNFAVRELHIDLLLLEEFYSSDAFRMWFISNEVGKDHGIGDLSGVQHSVFELERESDLEVAFQGSNGDTLFLIENKINAQFQPQQAEDYRNRGIEYVRRGRCSKFFTVLFAPENYIFLSKAHDKFDYCISFERVIEFFNSQRELGDRARYKVEVLRRAINKQSNTGSGSDANEGITQFWHRYWEDTSVRMPELHMPRPGDKPSASTFITVVKELLPLNVNIYHKLLHGHVDLQFESLGDRKNSFVELFCDAIEPNMTIQVTSKGAVVRIEVPTINPHLFFEDVLDDVRKGQDAAKRLLSWFRQHSDLWTSFKDL